MHPLAHNSVRTESAPQHCCLPDHLRSEEQIRLIEIVLQRSWILLATAEPPAANGTTWWNSRNPRSVHLPRAPMNAQRPSSRRQTSRLTAAGTCRDAGAPARGSRGRDVEAHFCFSKCSISADNARSNTTATSPVGTGRYLATGTGDCGRVSLILHGRVPLSVVGRRRPMLPKRAIRGRQFAALAAQFRTRPAVLRHWKTQVKTARWVSTSINRLVREIVEWSGGALSSPSPRNGATRRSRRSPCDAALRIGGPQH
jgi:hypothetical protein